MTARDASAALDVRGVAISFGGLATITDLSFSVGQGEVVSLIGPNGAGKTTALNIITGFLKPHAGTIHFGGTALIGLPTHVVAGLGVVRTFQKTNLFHPCDAFENVLTGLHRRGSASLWQVLLGLRSVAAEDRRLRKDAEAILEFVGLAARRHVLSGALAYGEQRLLEVAIALAARPSLLLLDEPVSGMNPAETDRFIGLLRKIQAQGITVLLVEHDMRLVMNVSDRIVVLNQGRIIASGEPARIRNDPAVVLAYLGRRRHDA